MRIVVLTSLYPSSVRPNEGVFAERRWAGMRSRGHDVRVVHPLPWAPLTLGRRDWSEIGRMAREEVRGGIEIERPRYAHVPRSARSNAGRFARCGVRAVLARERPEVVVADYAWPASSAAPSLAREGVACVVNGRGSDVLQVAETPALARELGANLRAAGHWCAVSRDLVERMDALAGSRRGVLVPNGVDGTLFRPRERAACRRELEFGATGPLVLVVGHLIERKDPLLALECAAELAKSRDDLQLVFLGRGALENALRERIDALGMRERTHVLGDVAPQRLALWYGAADALLLTSRREGRPNVVLEALSSGLPVLATDAGGSAELVAGHDGMLARDRDARALAAMLGALLDRPRSPEQLAASVAPLTWDASLHQLELVLANAIAAGGGARA